MVRVDKWAFLVLIILLVLSSVDALDVVFDSPGTQFFNITISSPQITAINFNITGVNNSDSFPSNISLDIADDGIIDWEYRVFHSNEIIILDDVLAVWSNNPNSGTISFVNLTNDTSPPFETYAHLTDNVFFDVDSISNGSLGLSTADSMDEQVISVVTDNRTHHVFVPEINLGIFANYYIAEGGSSYFCNTDHSLNAFDCNLNISQALVPEHLAREADMPFYNVSEPVINPLIVDSINSKLLECGSFPCNISVKVVSESVGILRFSDFVISESGLDTNITLTEETNYYDINISSENNITNSFYFYGDMPKVYVVPVMASDEVRALDENQSNRLFIINNSLREIWDNITNRSHPLNFTFFLEPIRLDDYKVADNNFSLFWDDIISNLEPRLEISKYGILIYLDIFDYFPDKDAVNALSSPTETENYISRIYMNGFLDINNKTKMDRYDEEILTNILIHELGHTFIQYPVTGLSKYFHLGHPASFTDRPEFNTFDEVDSPTGNEGYYEIYSIMNQIRVFMRNGALENIPIRFSTLDLMLLGTLNSYEVGNYSFYEGVLSRSGYDFNMSGISLALNKSATSLYSESSDSLWWDVRTYSSIVDMGINKSFNVSKDGQNNRALWVYGESNAYPDFFKVFNNNANSIQNYALTPSGFNVNFISPSNLFWDSSYNGSILFECEADSYGDATIKNISLIIKEWDSGLGSYEDFVSVDNLTGTKVTYSGNLVKNNYLWSCFAYDNDSNVKHAINSNGDNSSTFIISDIDFLSPADGSNVNFNNVTLSFFTTEEFPDSCKLYGNFSGGWAVEMINESPNDGMNSFSLNLNNGSYKWGIWCNDSYEYSMFSENLTFTVNISNDNISNDNISNSSGFRIENISVVSHEIGAIISWETVQSSNYSFSWGLSSLLGNDLENLSTSLFHSVSLNNLNSNTTYFYLIKSCNSTGVCNVSEILNFTTDSFVFFMNWSEWYNGTTNFSLYNDSELESVNVSFKNEFGSIEFFSLLNLSSSINFSGKVWIKNNSIFLDSVLIPNFNRSALIRLNNLTFNVPQILRDSVVCSSCNILNYTNGTLIFNVSGFSNYSARETPFCGDGNCDDDESCNSCSSDCGVCSGGGSGGGSSSGVGLPPVVINSSYVGNESNSSEILNNSLLSLNIYYYNNFSFGFIDLVKILSYDARPMILIKQINVSESFDSQFLDGKDIYQSIKIIDSDEGIDSFEEVVMYIKVDMSWIFDNHSDSKVIEVARVNNESILEKLEFKFVNQTDDYMMYEFNTSEFGIFLIWSEILAMENNSIVLNNSSDVDSNNLRSYKNLNYFFVALFLVVIIAIFILVNPWHFNRKG